MAAAEKTLRLRIRGRVQGVAFRDWTVREATRRALRGWVRNRADGSVEALLSGPVAAVDDMAQACRTGPRLAAVTAIDATPDADDGTPDFRMLPTV
jgi:acylphosphatase